MSIITDALSGCRILIVEDEILLAIDLQHTLEENGCDVIDIAPSVARAIDAIADQSFDAATLDLNLRGESSRPVADALYAKGIPFIVTSGYTKLIREFTYQDAPFVRKPVDEAELMGKLRALFA